MKIAFAQINSLMGNIASNEKKIRQYILKAHKQKVQLMVFPEMALSGYPPLDLIHKKHFLKEISCAVRRIHKQIPGDMSVLLGSAGPGFPPGNSVFLLQENKKAKIFSKEYLADYDVFDEQRYFKKGRLKNNFFVLQNTFIQILICEEIWQKPNLIMAASQRKKPKLIISINASPFGIHKHQKRIQTAGKWTEKYQSPLLYLNCVGGQEELIFDGGSFILNKSGQTLYQSPFFKEELGVFSLSPLGLKKRRPLPGENSMLYRSGLKIEVLIEGKKPQNSNRISIKRKKIRQALAFGLKEFMEKNEFEKVHLGLSGGVDSALVAALACEALGEKKVSLLFLPGLFTSKLSEKCVHIIAKKLKCSLLTQNITNYYSSFLNIRSFNLKQSNPITDLARQNIQARLRCLILMAYANKHPKSLLLGTSNKSELAIGYSTLYGDLTGGLLPIGDLFKTEVYQMAHEFKIPSLILKRKASAELKKDQTDEKDLFPYEKLDSVLYKLIELGQEPNNFFERQIFRKIIKSEFKRRQSPPILKIKNHSFDKGWRLPLSVSITS